MVPLSLFGFIVNNADIIVTEYHLFLVQSNSLPLYFGEHTGILYLANTNFELQSLPKHSLHFLFRQYDAAHCISISVATQSKGSVDNCVK